MAEMKQLMVGVLLVACVVIVCGQEQGHRRPRRDPCTNGMAAVHMFMEFRGCGHNIREITDNLMRMLHNNLTVHNLDAAFTQYCSLAFPIERQCFIDNIQNCSRIQQDMLTRVVQQTGSLCQPDSSSVQPVITHLLSRLTDEDLEGFDQCYDEDNVQEIHHRCYNKALLAMGYTMDNISNIELLGMEQLVGKINTYFPTAARCMVEGYRDNPGRCSQWRGLALDSFRQTMLPTFLGRTNTFTNDDIDDMFGWSSDYQTTN